MGFPDSSVGKESACIAEDTGSIPVLGRSPGEGIGYLLQYSALENSMNYMGLQGLSDSLSGELRSCKPCNTAPPHPQKGMFNCK